MKKKIFEFSYTEYLGKVHGIRVNDNNTVFVWFGVYGDDEEGPIAITSETTEKIRSVIRNNQEVFAIKEVGPEGILMDGSFESFYINDGEKTAKIKASNIEYCKGNEDADMIIAMHNEIADILKTQGFDKKYFLLYTPIEYGLNDVLDLDAATEIAMEWVPSINSCQETKDAFIFSYPGLENTVGPQPIVVLKKDGKRIAFIEYLLFKSRNGLDPDDGEVIAEHTI